MKILVTGGAGFIGSHIADAYLAAGHSVSVLDWQADRKKYNLDPRITAYNLDINDPRVEAIFQDARFDVVNHHAAQMSVPVSVKDPIADATTNVFGALRLLQYSTTYGVKKWVFASSGGTVYGPTDRQPVDESMPFDASSPYGVTKIATELYLRTWAINHKLRYTALRYANVYGPRQDAHGESGVVAIFIEKMLAGQQPTVFGKGEDTRDYVFVADIVRANVLALDKGDGEGINIGTGQETNTNRIFDILKDATGFPGPRVNGPARPGDVPRSCINAAKAKKILGWEPQVTIEDGLKRTVEWFKSRQAKK